ncbi:MAG TPA: hypothetical protein VNR86_03395 [Sphingomicrobium sp.]|nr:hypothetical protein [Sphingomicrobium sp.]
MTFRLHAAGHMLINSLALVAARKLPQLAGKRFKGRGARTCRTGS